MYTAVGIKTLLLNAQGAQKAAGFTEGQSRVKLIARSQRVDLRHMLIARTQKHDTQECALPLTQSGLRGASDIDPPHTHTHIC